MIHRDGARRAPQTIRVPQMTRGPISTWEPPKLGSRVKIGLALWIALLAFGGLPARAQDLPADSGMRDHQHMSMQMDGPNEMNEHDHAKMLADKKESEFNHHLAGIFVILAGIFLLAENSLASRWSSLRYLWPLCFLIAGVLMLFFSDTELWPVGRISWWYGMTHDAEDLQHKAFAVILLILGFVELQRARGVLKSAWAGWVFPVAAFCGSVLLLFHEHHPGMNGADHMTVMARVQSEHLNFAVTGFGIGILKGLSEVKSRWQLTLARLWPVGLITLGILLMLYTE